MACFAQEKGRQGHLGSCRCQVAVASACWPKLDCGERVLQAERAVCCVLCAVSLAAVPRPGCGCDCVCIDIALHCRRARGWQE